MTGGNNLTNYIYRLIAYKDSSKCVLAEYRGDDTGLYNMQIERVEIKTEKRCSNTGVSCGSESCTCDA